MAATTGTIYAVGSSGRNYTVSVYVPDAVAGIVLFNPTGAATSTSSPYWRAPENVVVKECVFLAAPTATTLVATSDGAQFAGNSILYGANTITQTYRPQLGWAFRQGSLIGAVNA